MQNFCSISEVIQNPSLGWWILFAVSAFLSMFFIRGLFMQTKNAAALLFYSVLSFLLFLLIFIPTAIYLVTTSFLPFEDAGIPYSLNQMHAAIKNTCLVDPYMRNCPHNVDEIIRLYPAYFEPIRDQYALTYFYYPETNNYTLIARPKDSFSFARNWNNVAVFDQRLNGSEISGGWDLVSLEAYACGDKYILKKKPNFPGPWDQIN